jgi:hypothetical protein
MNKLNYFQCLRSIGYGTALLLGPILAFGRGIEGVSLAPEEQWSNLTGGKEAIFHYRVQAESSFECRLGWHLSAASRPLARGEKAVNVSPGNPQVVEIRVPVPPVREGVVLATDLSVTLYQDRSAGVETNVTRRLWVFPENPLADRLAWLKTLDLRLFDPAKKTAEAFTRAGIPFKTVPTLDVVPSLHSSVVVIGEGVSARNYRGLGDVMAHAMAAGVPILCLSVTEGTVKLPGLGETAEKPDEICFRRNAVIRELDKRLDDEVWPPDGRIVIGGFQIKGERGPIVVEAVPAGQGWPWLEIRQGERGRIVLCGFGIVSKWDAGPTAKCLLAAILERLAGLPADTTKKAKE